MEAADKRINQVPAPKPHEPRLTAGAPNPDYSVLPCNTSEAAMFEGLRFSHWQAETDGGGIVVLTLDRAGASVNALNRAVIDELARSSSACRSIRPRAS